MNKNIYYDQQKGQKSVRPKESSIKHDNKGRGILDRHNSMPLTNMNSKSLKTKPQPDNIPFGSSALKKFLYQDPNQEKSSKLNKNKENIDSLTKKKPDSAKLLKNSLTKTVNFRDEEMSHYIEPTTKDSARRHDKSDSVFSSLSKNIPKELIRRNSNTESINDDIFFKISRVNSDNIKPHEIEEIQKLLDSKDKEIDQLLCDRAELKTQLTSLESKYVQKSKKSADLKNLCYLLKATSPEQRSPLKNMKNFLSSTTKNNTKLKSSNSKTRTKLLDQKTIDPTGLKTKKSKKPDSAKEKIVEEESRLLTSRAKASQMMQNTSHVANHLLSLSPESKSKINKEHATNLLLRRKSSCKAPTPCNSLILREGVSNYGGEAIFGRKASIFEMSSNRKEYNIFDRKFSQDSSSINRNNRKLEHDEEDNHQMRPHNRNEGQSDVIKSLESLKERVKNIVQKYKDKNKFIKELNERLLNSVGTMT